MTGGPVSYVAIHFLSEESLNSYNLSGLSVRGLKQWTTGSLNASNQPSIHWNCTTLRLEFSMSTKLGFHSVDGPKVCSSKEVRSHLSLSYLALDETISLCRFVAVPVEDYFLHTWSTLGRDYSTTVRAVAQWVLDTQWVQMGGWRAQHSWTGWSHCSFLHFLANSHQCCSFSMDTSPTFHTKCDFWLENITSIYLNFLHI